MFNTTLLVSMGGLTSSVRSDCFSSLKLDLEKVWERSEEGVRGLLGCGSVWLPTTGGKSNLEIVLWNPVANKLVSLENLSGF
jgi:hypothetical protein